MCDTRQVSGKVFGKSYQIILVLSVSGSPWHQLSTGVDHDKVTTKWA